MPTDQTPALTGGITMTYYNDPRAEFNSVVRIRDMWLTRANSAHRVSPATTARIAELSTLLGQLLDAAHTEALTERLDRMTTAELLIEVRHNSRELAIREGWITTEALDRAHSEALQDDHALRGEYLCDECDAFACTEHTTDAILYSHHTSADDNDYSGCVTGRTHCVHCVGDCSECVDAADQRHLQHVSFDAESADQRGLGMIEAAIEWLIEWYGITDDELYLANLTDMWSHIMIHANSTN